MNIIHKLISSYYTAQNRKEQNQGWLWQAIIHKYIFTLRVSMIVFYKPGQKGIFQFLICSNRSCLLSHLLPYAVTYWNILYFFGSTIVLDLKVNIYVLIIAGYGLFQRCPQGFPYSDSGQKTIGFQGTQISGVPATGGLNLGQPKKSVTISNSCCPRLQ